MKRLFIACFFLFFTSFIYPEIISQRSNLDELRKELNKHNFKLNGSEISVNNIVRMIYQRLNPNEMLGDIDELLEIYQNMLPYYSADVNSLYWSLHRKAHLFLFANTESHKKIWLLIHYLTTLNIQKTFVFYCLTQDQKLFVFLVSIDNENCTIDNSYEVIEGYFSNNPQVLFFNESSQLFSPVESHSSFEILTHRHEFSIAFIFVLSIVLGVGAWLYS